MEKVRIRGAGEGFAVRAGTGRSQAATMVMAPGESTGGPDNAHRGSDQWLYVVDGRAAVTVEGREVTVEPGELLLIEAGETHEVRSTGEGALVTLNVYAPPEY
ncbi:MAG TPA: cupin domain-containing protein [Sandaracinaceae bacterium LLY-WYZ-13_1]|nr:cupin domain-containing protein [Sandaracinaceae bacterium LLY-WYZ-13_1]